MRPPPPSYNLRFSNTTGIRHQSVMPFLSGTRGDGGERRAKYKKIFAQGKIK